MTKKKLICCVLCLFLCLIVSLLIKEFYMKSDAEKAIIYSVKDSKFDYDFYLDENNKALTYYITGNDDFNIVFSKYNGYLSENPDSVLHDYSISLKFADKSNLDTYLIFSNFITNEKTKHDFIDTVIVKELYYWHFDRVDEMEILDIDYCIGMKKNNMYILDKFPNLSEIYCDYADGSDEYNEMREQIALWKPEVKVFPKLQGNQ